MIVFRSSKSILLVLAVIFLTAVTVFAQEPSADEKAALEFINHFPKIRLLIQKAASSSRFDRAPGNGTEAASALVLRRLLAMGYQGQVEVVYGYWIKHKMNYLVPGYDINGPDRQQISSQVVVTSMEEFASQPREKLAFGLTGADDYTSSDQAKELNVELFLHMNPRLWTSPSRLLHRSGDKTVEVPLDHLHEMAYAGLITEEKGAASVLAKELSTKDYQAKKNFIESLFNQRNKIDFMPVYNVERDRGEVKLGRLVTALRTMIQKDKMFGKPIVMGIFSEMIDNKAELAKLVQASDVKIIEAVDPKALEVLSGANAGEIVLVHIGFVPQAVYEIMFAMGDLPAVCAGKSTSNFLQFIAKPFLATHTKEIEDLQMELPGYEVYKQGAHGLRGELADAEAGYQALKIFVQQSRLVNSPLRLFFTELRRRILQNDKLIQGLKAARDFKARLKGTGCDGALI